MRAQPCHSYVTTAPAVRLAPGLDFCSMFWRVTQLACQVTRRCVVAPSQVIREARPCHLYFDLEFVPAINPGACGDAFVDALLRLVAAELRCVDTPAFGLEAHQPCC